MVVLLVIEWLSICIVVNLSISPQICTHDGDSDGFGSTDDDEDGGVGGVGDGVVEHLANGQDIDFT